MTGNRGRGGRLPAALPPGLVDGIADVSTITTLRDLIAALPAIQKG